MRTLRRLTPNEYKGFDRHGIFVGSAYYCPLLSEHPGWRLSIVGEEERYVDHEDEACQALLDAGAVTLKSSDGRKY